MNKFFCFFLLITTLSFSAQAAFISSTNDAARVPEYLKVENFIRMNVAQFQEASGHKLSLIQRIYFKKLQRQLSKTPALSGANLLQFYDVQKGKFKLDMLWFILGAIIGPFAILFSYTTKQPRAKRLSALIGFGIFVLWFGFIFIF